MDTGLTLQISGMMMYVPGKAGNVDGEDWFTAWTSWRRRGGERASESLFPVDRGSGRVVGVVGRNRESEGGSWSEVARNCADSSGTDSPSRPEPES